MRAHEKATPRPWQVSSGSGSGYAVRGDNKPLAEIWLNGDDPLANAALIVEAVNSFEDRQWRADVENAPKDRVIEVVGRVETATAGFPQYAMWWEDEQSFLSSSYSAAGTLPLIIWAWRERTDWPSEPRA